MFGEDETPERSVSPYSNPTGVSSHALFSVHPPGTVMTKNMGSLDRILRTLAALLVGILYLTGTLGGTTAAILGMVALAFVLTSFVGTCPLYAPIGFSTRKTTE